MAVRPTVWVPLAAVVLAGLLVLLLGPVAWWATPAKHLQGKDKADVRNATRQILLAAVGGLVLLTGAAFTARTFFLSRRGQFTDRYARAIGQIASDKLTERLGGIYALEHLMIESEREHHTVVEVLAAFIRERTRPGTTPPDGAGADAEPAPAPGGPYPSPPTDVQAALTVLGRRPDRPELNAVDLRGVDVRGANLSRARLPRVLLLGARLQGAHLINGDLQGAELSKAQLQDAILAGAQLQGATLWAAQLHGADLSTAEVRGRQLHGAVVDDRTRLPPVPAGGEGPDPDAWLDDYD